ncbi:Uncharacterized protein SCF082_LOCUS10036 [Durusdinium trenchii]|uniref:Uncharacterized protein n=1 Tax=Durusdinium trenchii TaxID=1381693 RepID=A0ABP0J395_9DINO
MSHCLASWREVKDNAIVAALLETWQLAGEEPKVVNGSSPNPCRVAAERPVYRNKGVGKGKHGGKNAGHAAWLLGLDEPPEPLREPMHPPTEPAEQAELPAPEPVSKPEQVSVTQGRQHEESAVESRTEESSVESKEHEETRMICEIDPAEIVAWTFGTKLAMFHGMSPGRNVASLGQESDRIYPGACGPETAGALQHRAMGNCGLVWGDEDDEVTQEKLIEAVENMDADEVERLLEAGLKPYLNKSIDGSGHTLLDKFAAEHSTMLKEALHHKESAAASTRHLLEMQESAAQTLRVLLDHGAVLSANINKS